MKWYTPYLQVYNTPFCEEQYPICDEVKQRISRLQSDAPVVTVSVIAYNEERHLLACLWSLSMLQTKYPIEIIGVDNESVDRTREIFERCGVPCYTETQHSCGWARQCGLNHARGRYHFNIDSDTMYPALYVDKMMDILSRDGVVGVSSLWSYIPDANHPAWGVCLFEFLRDTHLWMQHFKRPELSVRGLVFAYDAQLAKKIGIRTDIIRGEDGYLAFQLKEYGKIKFLRNRKARAVTGYGTVDAEGGFWRGFWLRIKKYLSGITSIFHSKKEYKDQDDNLVAKRKK